MNLGVDNLPPHHWRTPFRIEDALKAPSRGHCGRTIVLRTASGAADAARPQKSRLYQLSLGHYGRPLLLAFQWADGPIDVAVEAPLAVNNTDVILEPLGLACLLERSVARHIETGRLVRVLEAWCRPISGFFLYYPGHRCCSQKSWV
jgi:DNA-binding transcriptional LysR family regulator